MSEFRQRVACGHDFAATTDIAGSSASVGPKEGTKRVVSCNRRNFERSIRFLIV